MSSATLEFIQKIFLNYYTDRLGEIDAPNLFEKREFAALLLKERVMVRHKMFKTRSELQSFLRSVIPSDVYYSSAYYEEPDASDMSAKGWIGADLIFDIDADHIPTPCDKVHDEWTCLKCGFQGKGVAPETCPACGGEKFDENTWPCEVCLASAKRETIKLLDMLINDFAFSEQDIHTYFSGHRGYHVHVVDEAIQDMGAMARKEIVDYVCGLGFDWALQGREANPRNSDLQSSGWRSRVAKGIYTFIDSAEPQDYSNIGVKGSVVKTIMKSKDKLLKNREPSKTLTTVKGVGPETLKKIADHAMKSQSANVDTVVTTDIHRLIRLAGTLHGRTGLKKIEFDLSKILDFDPFRSAIAFKRGTATLFVSVSPQFRIGDETFGPYKSQRVELPTAAAALLVCKKRAEVEEFNVQ
jgi:DNA primase small subunit